MRYFLAVADELHFGRAAERLHMAQPPLSQQIRLLESELGVQLFERTTRRVSLTAAGDVFRTQALRLVTAADAAERVMDEFRSGEGGLLRLAFVDSAAFQVMPKYLRAHRQHWPKVHHDLTIMSSRAQVDALRSGEIDIGISRTPADDDDLTGERFLVEQLFLAVGPDDETTADAITVSELADRPLIGFDRRLSPTLHEDLTALLSDHGHEYAPLIEATEYTTILGLVASGEGAAIVPDGVRTFEPAGVRYLRIDDLAAQMSMFCNHRRDDPLRVVAHARDVIATLFDN